MIRYKIIIEYDGTNYVGWQKQDNGPSIQEAIESAIFKQSGEKIELFGAGRTDAGVHALSQVAHFDIEKNFSEDSIRDGLNKHLRPQPIAILHAEKVNQTFHARFSAKQRHYSYTIVNRRSPLTIEKNFAWIVHKKLDTVLMRNASKLFLGNHDFNAFRSINCQSKSSVKTIDFFDVTLENNKIIFRVKARSFLHSQVRIMVGTLVYVGEKKFGIEDVKQIIRDSDRNKAGPTAPSQGLCLVEVTY